jgi:hypothetical protein
MQPRKLTVVDVCAVTGYQRDSLQTVLKELPPYNEYAKKPRIAREFTPNDIIALCVIYELEIHYGVKRKMIGKISEMLSHTLSGPKPVASNAKLCISFTPPSVIYTTSVDLNHDGIYLSLKGVFERADQYLSYGGSIFRSEQAELMLPPVAITTKAKRIANA